jgi:D-glycero-alpha-D-manno-heptose-7-phosphate kinase
MIIIKSPLRITLGGGGTDLPSFYEKFGGFLISATINKYIYITMYEPFKDYIFLKYANYEKVKKIEKIKHPIIKKIFKKYLKNFEKIEMQIAADVPAGTGMGSSGAFTAGVIKSIYSYKNRSISHNDLAEKACEIEIKDLKRNVGKQDQYSSVYGGINSYKFTKNKVIVKPLKISNSTLESLEDNLCLYFTKFSRSADKILKNQNSKTKKNNKEIIKNLQFNKELGMKSKIYLENEKLDDFAEILNEQWRCKFERSPETINPRIKNLYDIGLRNGATGGKLIGAGGGGFLMFYANDKEKLDRIMKKEGIEKMKFNFDFNGVTRIV